MYRLKDNQIQGRYFGGGVSFNSLAEVKDVLEDLANADSEENYDFSGYPIRELLEITDYEIEEEKENE
jgi:hypothetical protein